jgi:hypothetical protein
MIFLSLKRTLTFFGNLKVEIDKIDSFKKILTIKYWFEIIMSIFFFFFFKYRWKRKLVFC